MAAMLYMYIESTDQGLVVRKPFRLNGAGEVENIDQGYIFMEQPSNNIL